MARSSTSRFGRRRESVRRKRLVSASVLSDEGDWRECWVSKVEDLGQQFFVMWSTDPDQALSMTRKMAKEVYLSVAGQPDVRSPVVVCRVIVG